MTRKNLKLLNICLYLALHIADAYVPYTSCTDLLYWDGYLWILYNVYVRGWASMEISRRNCCIKGNTTKLLSSGMQAVCRFARNSFSTSFQDGYHLFIIFKGRLKRPVFLSRWVSRWTERRKKLWNVTQKLSLFFFPQALFHWCIFNTTFRVGEYIISMCVNLKKLKNNEANCLLRTS